MRYKRFCLQVTCSFAVGMTVASSSSALASEGGHIASARVSETSYRHYFDDMLYAHEGDDRGWPDGAQHDLARDNIAMLLTSFGLDVTLHEFTLDDSPGYNVVATKPGTVFQEQEYLVGAHYDSGSNPGADDNASGVALLLETARVLSAYESEYTIRFVAFDAEEWMVAGSAAYVLDHAGDDILGMINADMVAFSNGEDHMRVRTHPDHDAFRSAIGAAVDTYGGGMAWSPEDNWLDSDHYSFYLAGYQACQLRDEPSNPYFHTAEDHVDMPDYIDYAYATKITRATVGFLVDHANVQVPLPDADFDDDGDVDEDDFAQFAGCFAGSGNPVDPPCDFFDFETDGDVDCVDWRLFKVRWTGPPYDPPVFVTCDALPPIILGVGNRCVPLDPDSLGSSIPLAIYVSSAASEPVVDCISRYVQANHNLGSTPIFQSPEDWGTVVVRDDEIVPGASYYIQSDYGEPGSPLLSPTVRITTPLWGDTVGDFSDNQWTLPDGDVNFSDITSIVDAFKNLPTAPAAYRVELVGPSGSECHPNLDIDFLDISAGVEAFKGYDYWETTSCPSPCD